MLACQRSRRPVNPLVILLVPLIAASLFVGMARAAIRGWNVGDGNWSVPGNWSPAGVPGSNDTANIMNTDGVSRTITYDYTGGAVTLGLLTVDLTGGMPTDTETLSMAANNLTSATEFVGYSGTGSNGSGTFNQSGGVNTINSTAIYLGVNATDTGYYNLSGTGSLVSVGEVIGYNGAGIFTQSGGTNTPGTGNLYLGYSSGSNGTYVLNSGLLTMGNGFANSGSIEYLGFEANSSGTFTQNGGTNTISNSNSLYIAYGANSQGGYTLAGGALAAATEYVGYVGTGSFSQSGGTNRINANGGLVLGQNVGATGTYTLTGGVLSSAAGETVGNFGVGAFDQSGGTNSTTSGTPIYLGYQNNGTTIGTYYLSGTGALSPGGSEYIGYGAEGDFYQSNGVNTISSPNFLFIAYSSGVPGSYSLSGTGVLISHAFEFIGYFGHGAFSQSGGVNMVRRRRALDIGILAGSNGAYTISGGTTTVSGNVNVGNSANGGIGTLEVDGGTLTVGGTLVFSNVPGSSMSLNGGTINAAALNFNGNLAALSLDRRDAQHHDRLDSRFRRISHLDGRRLRTHR